MDVSVIIVNYRTQALTAACIESVIRYTTGIRYEIILVENGSGEFLELPPIWREHVQLIVCEKNLGFAGGNNLGIQASQGKYVLLLNSDTYLKNNAIQTLFSFSEARAEKIGAVSPKLIYPEGKIQSVAQRFPSIKYSLIELLRGQKFLGAKKGGRVLLGSFFSYDESVRVDWVWAACMMIPKDIIRRMKDGKLDESYFMYWEDVQWCLDINKLGYEVYFCADAEVVHIHQGSGAAKSEFMVNNELRFMERNYPSWKRKLIRQLNKWLTKG